MITTVVEGKRGCGYRKEGGLYLRTDGIGRYCGALPIELTVCPTCHAGIKPARGWTWVNLAALVAAGAPCKAAVCGDCPIADAQVQEVGLIWVGEKFYPTTRDFNKEAEQMGLSRRITAIPKRFKLGETWVALAHRKAIPDGIELTTREHLFKAGIFHVFKPSRIEYVVRDNDDPEKLAAMEARGLTLVKVIRKEEPNDKVDQVAA